MTYSRLPLFLQIPSRHIVSPLIAFAVFLTAFSFAKSETGPQLKLALANDEIVITSTAGVTWKAVVSVSQIASAKSPGGGTIRALHIPADNPESVVGTEPKRFGHSAWGIDNLEWRYVPERDKPGIRRALGTNAVLDRLEIQRPTDNEIIIELSGRWQNVTHFTRRIAFNPNGWHSRITADWDGPDKSYGMWWMWSLFESDWMDNQNVTIQDSDTEPVPLPIFQSNVQRVPESIDFPYTINFPLLQGPAPHLRFTLNEFGPLEGSKGGPFYELWPEMEARNPVGENDTYKVFIPRWVARGIQKRQYTFDYEWRIQD